MRFVLSIGRTALLCLVTSSPALAAHYNPLPEGQYPLPPSLSNETAQPECGFAAEEGFGPNGFQWCDRKNIYPRPLPGYRR